MGKLHVRQTILAVGFLATPTRTTRAIAKGTCSAIRVMFRLKIMRLIGPSTRLASDVTIGRIVKGLTAQATATGENWLILRLHVRQTLLAVGFLATPARTTRPIAKGTCSAIRVMSRLKILSLIGASTRLASDVTIGRTVKGLTAQATATGENLLILRLNVRQTLIAVGFLATPTRTTRPIAKGTCSAVRVISRLKILSLIGASTRRLRSNDAVCK